MGPRRCVCALRGPIFGSGSAGATEVRRGTVGATCAPPRGAIAPALNAKGTIMRKSHCVAALACAVGLGASVDIASAIGTPPPGFVKCPCVAGPYPAMPKTKWMTMYPNGDKFKMNCSNESGTGDFLSKYCKAGGGQICIGRCIYVGGDNMITITTDAAGNPCTITHKNTDDAVPDNPTHQRKVYVYDVKAGTITTTCYKRNPDGTYTPVGRPVCRRAVIAMAEPFDGVEPLIPTDDEEMNEDILFKRSVADVIGVAPQMAQLTTAAEISLPTGAREIRFFTPGEVSLRTGDTFYIRGVRVENLTRIDGKFEARMRAGGSGVELVALADSVMVNNDLIARVSADFTGPFDVHGVASGSAERTEVILAHQCTDIAIPTEVIEEMTVDVYSNISAPPFAADANRDGFIDARDIAEVLGGFGHTGGRSDVNLDGAVNSADLMLVLVNYGFRED